MPKLIQVPEKTLRVLSLNMQWGSGPEDNEPNFMGDKPISKKEIDHNLDEIVDLIDEVNPEIIELQEVDKCSGRTYFMDQTKEIVQKIAKKRDQKPYNSVFASCIELYQHRLEEEIEKLIGTATKFLKINRFEFGRKLKHFVPFVLEKYNDKKYAWIFNKLNLEPGRLPPGKITLHFGNAILVHPDYPIKGVKHEYFFRPSAIPIMYFNIMSRRDERKNILRIKIDYCPDVPEKIPLYVINTHLENYDKYNRQKQANILYEKLNERSGAHKIVAGDFNDSKIIHRFINHPNMSHFNELVEQEQKYATYPAWKDFPDSLFDAILPSRYLTIENYFVHPKKVSDHYAVVADITINHDLVPENLLKRMLERSG